MANLMYQVEFFQGYNGKPSDEGVFIQLRHDVPSYIERTGKEDYDPNGDDGSDFLTDLFNVNGVVVVSTTAYRVYIEKSPTYSWDEIINPVVEVIRGATGLTGVSEIAPPQYLENKISRRIYEKPKT